MFDSRQQLERRRYITQDEYRSLLAASKRVDPRAYILFFLCGNLGLRVGEFHQIRFEDVRFRDNRLVVHTLKQRKWKKIREINPKTGRACIVKAPVEILPDELVVSPAVTQVIREWVNKKKIQRGPLFRWSKRTSQYLWSRYAEKVRILVAGDRTHKGRGIHCLRHLRGLWLAETGDPIQEIQAQLRHRSSRSTEIYVHATKQKEIVRKAGVIR
jgi:integrase